MQYYSVKEAAQKLGVSIKVIQSMCEKGRFKDVYQSENGEWFIHEANFITTREQDTRADEVLQLINRRNREVDNKVEPFIHAQIVADYYGTTLDQVKQWIEYGVISGKKCEDNPDIYVVSKEEFDYLKEKREQDDSGKAIQEFLGDDFIDWDFDMDD